MKINIILFGIITSVLYQQANALCQCPEGDIACLQSCVDKTKTCIASCGSSTVCYNACIQDSWPGQTLTTIPNNVATSTISQIQNSPSSVVKTDSRISAAPTLTSIPASNANIPSSIPGGSSKTPISSSERPIPTYPEFSPKPPTSSTAPPPTSGSSKSLLVPGVAIGVAMVTVIVQLFFLARMGTVLFRS